MPGLVRKLLIFAAVDGLVLQPLAQKGQRPAPSVKIAYKDASIGPALGDTHNGEHGFEAFGIVGLLKLSNTSYLVSITRRQQVAQIHGKSIFVITDVALTPLSSRREAETAIESTQKQLSRRKIDKDVEDSDTEDEGGEQSAAVSDDVSDDEAATPVAAESNDSTIPGPKRRSSIAEDVLKRKGGYGRFASNWFSGKGWTLDQRRNLGLTASATDTQSPKPHAFNSCEENDTRPVEASATPIAQADTAPPTRSGIASLLPKLLRTTRLLFGSSHSFFFSYDYDITRSLATQQPTRGADMVLYKDVDPLFFWNRSIMEPFIDAGQTSFVLPLMQGFVGQKAFTVESNASPLHQGESSSTTVSETTEIPLDTHADASETTDITNDAGNTSETASVQSLSSNTLTSQNPVSQDDGGSFLITLISRRSTKRAGLRYLRRGVDHEGNTANSVETEQILSSPDWSAARKTYSFVQVRGSIPLFFSQSPYSFKPVPTLQQSAETNYQAFKRHFENLSARYGSIQVDSLVEKHAVEAQIGAEFEKVMQRLNESGGVNGEKVGFEWFDFHDACRGMKFENVSLLLDTLGPTLDGFGTTIQHEDKLVSKQSGVLRTNCMDCLDRTNVVQSACGRRALELQLKEEGFDLGVQVDQTTAWFNNLWADNGDAISKQYASTAALKGDFTRTRKRNYKGALTDMGLSISRFYSGIVNDYFSQAVIDFLLGNVTALVFEDFESNLMSVDPAVSVKKMRQHAIEVSQKLVIEDQKEELIGGWALLTPRVSNTIKSTPFEESVLLLTDAALYACRFDWNLEKVSSFERVELRDIQNIKYGSYITSTLSRSQADEERNVGFVITYAAGNHAFERVNTRSMSTDPSARDSTDLLQGSAVSTALSGLLGANKSTNNERILAFKALPARSAVAEKNGEVPPMNEMAQVKNICAEIERVALAWKPVEATSEHKSIVERGDIISLAEARKATGIIEQLGHSLKKLVWA